MRWLVDEGIPKLIVGWLVARGDDVLDVAASPHVSSPDEALWRLAGTEGRFIITKDLGFMWPRLEPHPPGVILIRVPDSWNARQIAILVANTLEGLAAEALDGHVTLTEPGRTRQHSLRALPRSGR